MKLSQVNESNRTIEAFNELLENLDDPVSDDDTTEGLLYFILFILIS